MEHRATTAAALVPLLALAALLLGACDAAAAQRARPISQGPARACVEGVPGPVSGARARRRAQPPPLVPQPLLAAAGRPEPIPGALRA